MSFSRLIQSPYVHDAGISSIEDMSSIPYEGRADVNEIEDISIMTQREWKARLEAEIKKQNRSMRDVSLKAGKGPGYVHSILVAGKDPTIDNMIDVCNALGVSLSQILYGINVSPETEEILHLLETATPGHREGILKILRDHTNS